MKLSFKSLNLRKVSEVLFILIAIVEVIQRGSRLGKKKRINVKKINLIEGGLK